MTGTARRRHGALGTLVMLSGNVLTALVFTVLAPVLPEIAAHFGYGHGAFVAQMMMTMPGIGIIAGGIVAGMIIARAGLRPSLFGALLVFAAAGTAPLWLDGAAPLLASRFLLGAAAATAQTALVTLITAQFEEARRARLIGYAAAIGYSAAIAAILSSGAIAEAAGWRAPAALYLLALPILALASLTLKAAAANPARPVLRDTAKLLPMWPSYLAVLPLYAANYMLAIQFPFLLAANGVSSPAEKSWIMASGSIMAIGGAAASGWIRERWGQPRLFALTCLLLGLGEAVIGLSPSVAGIVAGVMIAGIAGGMILPALVNLIVGRAPLELRSAAIGLTYSAAYLGQFLNPVILTPLTGLLGLHGVFVCTGALLVVAAGVVGRRRQ